MNGSPSWFEKGSCPQILDLSGISLQFLPGGILVITLALRVLDAGKWAFDSTRNCNGLTILHSGKDDVGKYLTGNIGDRHFVNQEYLH